MHRELSKRASALFPAREDRERWDDFLTRELARADERVAAGSVTPTLDLGAFRSELAEFDFRAPRALSEAIVVDYRADGARTRSRDAPSLFRTVQSSPHVPCTVRGSYCGSLQSAARDFDHVTGCSRDRGSRYSVSRRSRRSPSRRWAATSQPRDRRRTIRHLFVR